MSQDPRSKLGALLDNWRPALGTGLLVLSVYILAVGVCFVTAGLQSEGHVASFGAATFGLATIGGGLLFGRRR